MRFDLTDDQRALAVAVREVCAKRFPVAHVQALAGGRAFDARGWAALDEAGVFSLRRPEHQGGVGLGMADAVVVFEELGRALVPGPLVGTHLAAGLVEQLRPGEAVAVLVRGARPLLIEHPDAIERVLVLGLDGAASMHVGELRLEAVERPLDPLTPLAVVGELPAGAPVADAGRAARLRCEGAALTAALLVGLAAETTSRATAYAKEREQFGRPVGAFQAVKHLLADMLVRAEVARAAVHSAGVHLDDDEVGDAHRAVRSAKVLAGAAALGNAKAAVQVHGGMGFTWDVPVHLFLKRAAVLDVAFGTPDAHASDLGDALLP